jgi:hypothetical protein
MGETHHPIGKIYRRERRMHCVVLPYFLGMADEYVRLGDMPPDFGDALMREFLPYSVAMACVSSREKQKFVVQPRMVGHGPTLFAGLSRRLDLKLVSRLEFGSGAVALRYQPRR